MSESDEKPTAATPPAGDPPAPRPKRARKTMVRVAPLEPSAEAAPESVAPPAPKKPAAKKAPKPAVAKPPVAAKTAAPKAKRAPATRKPAARPEAVPAEAEAVIHARVHAAGDAVRRALKSTTPAAPAAPVAPAPAPVAETAPAPVPVAEVAPAPVAPPVVADAPVASAPAPAFDAPRPLTLVFAAAEMAPFAKVGGLADVIGSLPAALAARGHRVHVFVPLYRQIDLSGYGTPDVAQVEVPWWGGSQTVVLRAIQHQGVAVYFVDYPPAFDRAGIYTDPDKKADYPDNALRWAFFARAVLAAVGSLGLEPDVLHANDHQTALVPVYQRTVLRDTPWAARAASVLSLHNMGYQGLYASGSLNGAGFPDDLFTALGPFEFYGHVNLLKAGVWFADMLTTVSERYAQEIQSSREYSYGLEGLLQTRGHDLVGIVNGVDYNYWDPKVDTHLPAKYTADDLSGKWLSKMELLKRCGLPPERIHAPVFGMVTRLVDQKGLDLLGEVAEQLLAQDVTLVVLGSGATEYQEMLSGLQHRFPDKVAADFTFNEPLAHLIEAGSDFFLMPSKYEPCGLNQLYSLRYGTIPIVRATGGLADTIEEWNGDSGTGTGFLFESYSSEGFWSAIQRALDAWTFPTAIDLLRRNGMAQDFSWARSAARYEMVYRWALERRGRAARVGDAAVAGV